MKDKTYLIVWGYPIDEDFTTETVCNQDEAGIKEYIKKHTLKPHKYCYTCAEIVKEITIDN